MNRSHWVFWAPYIAPVVLGFQPALHCFWTVRLSLTSAGIATEVLGSSGHCVVALGLLGTLYGPLVLLGLQKCPPSVFTEEIL